MIALEVGLNPGPSKHMYKAAASSTMLRLLVNEKANSTPPLFRLRYVRMNGVTVNHFCLLTFQMMGPAATAAFAQQLLTVFLFTFQMMGPAAAAAHAQQLLTIFVCLHFR